MGVKEFVEGVIASIVAGCSTHLLDLIKVRMQLQGENHPAKPARAILRPALAFHPTATGSIQMPLSTPVPKIGPVTVGIRIVQQEGVAALFSGVSATVLRHTLSTAWMGLYDMMKTTTMDGNRDHPFKSKT